MHPRVPPAAAAGSEEAFSPPDVQTVIVIDSMSSDLSGILGYHAVSAALATAGQPLADQFPLIRKAGFEVVINLALTTSDNALPNEGSLVAGLGMAYVHIPVDFSRPTPRDFEAFAGVLDAFRNRRVFVHCALNMRVSVFVFLYRVLRGEATRREAERDLKAIWDPDETWSRFIEDRLAAGKPPA